MKRRELLKFLGMAAALPVAVKAMPFPEDSTPLDISDYYPGNPTYSDIDWSVSPPTIATGPPLSIGTEVPRYFYIRSMEPSEGEKEIGIIEKRIYGSTS